MSEHVSDFADSVTCADLDGVPLVAVTGEVDEYNIDPVRVALDVQFSRRPDALVLDLAAVTFFGSAGLALLVETHQEAAAQDTVFVVVAPQRAVQRPLRVTGVDRLVRVADTLPLALAAVRANVG